MWCDYSGLSTSINGVIKKVTCQKMELEEQNTIKTYTTTSLERKRREKEKKVRLKDHEDVENKKDRKRDKSPYKMKDKGPHKLRELTVNVGDNNEHLLDTEILLKQFYQKEYAFNIMCIGKECNHLTSCNQNLLII